jgi:ubiquinone/menaquinone biosynthesis C-methylase UbiE
MAIETEAQNRRALQMLELEQASLVLEIGFGHGRTLARAAELAPGGFVAGIDPSAAMVEMAQRYNGNSIAKGVVEVRQASSERIPYPDETFDRVFAVHTLYFWKDPLAHLKEIRRVCRARGRFVLVFGPKEDEQAVASFPKSVYRFCSIDEIEELLSEAGFHNVKISRERIASRDIAFAVANR